MAIMVSVPIFSLVLIRLFWSGSSLWFLTVGIILLGAAAIVFLARRTGESQYGTQPLSAEASRVPLVLTGLGVLFLAMLILPNFAGGSSSPDIASPPAVESDTSLPPVSDSAGVSPPPVSNSPRRVVPQDSFVASDDPVDAVEDSTYIVADGDTLWNIALEFGVTVESIVEANDLVDETAISIDQELVIPADGGDETATAGR
jgi:LysM repeat protein